MKIRVNGRSEAVPDRCRLSELIQSLDVPRNYIAAEVNRKLVPRDQHESWTLAEGDEVEVVTLVGGG